VRFSPWNRKLWLTAHVAASVGWLGAIVVSLALAIAGLSSTDPLMVRSVFVVMELIGWTVLVPFSLASLATGLTQSFGTRWGVFDHYWVIVKLVVNVVSAAILLMYMGTLGDLATTARRAAVTGDLTPLRNPSPVLHSSLALVLLAGATVLSVYKPRGVTARGRRRQ